MSSRTTARQLLIFVSLSVALIGWLLLLNSPHEGVNASLHWDAEASITYGPAVGSKEELDAARSRLFDCLPLIRSTDPAVITKFYWTLKDHDDLTECRFYYSFVSDAIGHVAFEWGRSRFHTPLGAVLTYQFSAAAVMAMSLATLLTRRRLAARQWWAALAATAAISSSPIFLSISRQWLTETAGFAFFAATILACQGSLSFAANGAQRLRRGFWIWDFPVLVEELKNPRQSRWAPSVALALFAGASAFLTVRSRYTMGPALAIVLPVIALLAGPIPIRRRIGLAAAFAVTFAAGVYVDVFRFGPYIAPTIYDDVMVRSSRLFFHADPPYDKFLIAFWENLTFFVVPPILIWTWIATGRGQVAARIAGVIAIVIVAVMLWRTAAQQVLFQGRHLFPIAAVGIGLMYVVLPRIRWRTAPLIGVTTIALFLTVWNVCGTFGAQRRQETVGQPDVIAVLTKHLSTDGARLPRSVFRDLWWTDFDWADDRRLHDTLMVWNRTANQNALALIDDPAANAQQFDNYVHLFPAMSMRRLHGWTDSTTIAAARAAVARGQTVYLLTAPGRHPPAGLLRTALVDDVDLRAAALRTVTGVCPAGVVLESGVDSTANADGLTITRTRGTPGAFNGSYGWLPRVQQKWLTFDTDSSAVTYRVDGLRPGHRYQLGFVTWDPDRRGRSMRVFLDGKLLLSADDVDPHAAAGVAPTDVTANLPPVNGILRFESVRGPVVVCQLWVVDGN